MEIKRLLKTHFNFDRFRDDQEAITTHIINGGNALVIKPTGFGKSILYQLPALIFPGLTLVISPLIALMKDQVDNLRAKGIAAACINSSLNKRDRVRHYGELAAGKYKILFVSPERFRKPAFKTALQNCRVALLAIDEAHCISEWGHDFRPDYTRIREFRQITGSPPTIALTATATPQVQQDIIEQLGFQNHEIRIFRSDIDRPNLHLEVKHLSGEENKRREILNITAGNPGSGIVYFSLIRDLKYMSEGLHKEGIDHLIYHGDLSADQRRKIQLRFMAGKNKLILATNAFGMGIDKEDIRFIIHAQIPGSIESYYQEIGRAGRDNLKSRCTLLYDEDDISIHMNFIKWRNPSAEVYRRAYDLLKNEPEKTITGGIEYFRKNLSIPFGKDFTADTVLSLFERWGVTEGTFEKNDINVISVLPDFFSDQHRLNRKLKDEHEKLLKMVQYTKTEQEPHLYLNRYFSGK